MEAGKILATKAPEHLQCHSQRIAQHHLHRGGCRRSQVVGTHFTLHIGIEHAVRSACHVRIGIGRDGDDPVAQPAQHGHQGFYLGGVAAFGEHDHHVARHDGPQVAVHGIRRVHEHRGGAGRIERGDDLLSDQRALADAGYHYPRGAFEDHPHSFFKVPVQSFGQIFHSFCFLKNNIFSQLQNILSFFSPIFHAHYCFLAGIYYLYDTKIVKAERSGKTKTQVFG